MLLRNNRPANPKCNNVSAVWKSVNATTHMLLLLHCNAWTSKMRRQGDNRRKSAAAPQPKAKEEDLKSAMSVCQQKEVNGTKFTFKYLYS